MIFRRVQANKGLPSDNLLVVEFVVNLVITALLVLPYVMSRLTILMCVAADLQRWADWPLLTPFSVFSLDSLLTAACC